MFEAAVLLTYLITADGTAHVQPPKFMDGQADCDKYVHQQQFLNPPPGYATMGFACIIQEEREV